MASASSISDIVDVEIKLDELLGSEQHQSNCMFRLSLMMARIALEPVAEVYKDEMAQALLGLLRHREKGNVVPLSPRPRSVAAAWSKACVNA